MRTVLAISCLVVGAGAAMAQTATTPPPATTAKAPTMDQCKGGYKADYMKSMNWSKSAFDSACKTTMMKK
jgi:hypothetical protein